VFIVYAATLVSGEPCAGEEVQSAGFFPLDALPPLAFEHDEGIVREWSRGADAPDR
jgi:hypothetical protein